MTDGLSQLAQRGRRTREIPPPRNPAKPARVQLASVPEPATEPATPPDPTPSVPMPQPTRTVQPTAAPRTELKVVTVYLEQDDDDFLEAITHTGRTSRPKTAVSRSAVVRLALERLHAQMSATDIVDELRSRGNNAGTGRKRR